MRGERLLLNIMLLISVLFFTWWISVLVGLLLLFRRNAFEVVFWGFLMDVLYGVSLPAFWGFPLVMTSLFFVLYLVSVVLKQRLIFYHT